MHCQSFCLLVCFKKKMGEGTNLVSVNTSVENVSKAAKLEYSSCAFVASYNRSTILSPHRKVDCFGALTLDSFARHSRHQKSLTID